MRRVLLCLSSILALAGPTAAVASIPRPHVPLSAPAPPPGPHRAVLLAALNPIAGVVETGRFVEGVNVAHLEAVVYLIGVRKVYDAQPRPRAQARGYSSSAPVTATYSGDLSSVVACIKNAESGNYAESSHPGSGSGAYQFIPDTWRSWSIRDGYYLRDAKGNAVLDANGNQQALYDLAYLAPPNVQDAVLIFTLTHGGAGNWSNRFGADNCTAGLPGGG